MKITAFDAKELMSSQKLDDRQLLIGKQVNMYM